MAHILLAVAGEPAQESWSSNAATAQAESAKEEAPSVLRRSDMEPFLDYCLEAAMQEWNTSDHFHLLCADERSRPEKSKQRDKTSIGEADWCSTILHGV